MAFQNSISRAGAGADALSANAPVAWEQSAPVYAPLVGQKTGLESVLQPIGGQPAQGPLLSKPATPGLKVPDQFGDASLIAKAAQAYMKRGQA
mgnify:CR=1 FL=1